ncbi:MAG: hypothetical protein HOE79_04430, partial [Euryarchaeota archaeon]|nr:hypothetical protein [Euryarchaeota archaeon]
STSSTTHLIAANDSTSITLSVARNGPSTGLFAGSMGVPWTMTTTATDWDLEVSSNGEIGWKLEPEIIDDTIIDTNDDKTTPTNKKSNTGLFLGIGAFIVLGIIAGAIVILRPKDDDFDFDDEDWVDDEEMLESQHQSKAFIPKSNKTLDELKAEGTTIGDEAPDSRPSSQLLEEVDGESDYDEAVEEQQTEQSDDGITVDENGTEWYEDEVGVWWYREQGWEDWAEWQD